MKIKKQQIITNPDHLYKFKTPPPAPSENFRVEKQDTFGEKDDV